MQIEARACGSTGKNVWPALQPVNGLRALSSAQLLGHGRHGADLGVVGLGDDEVEVHRQPGLVGGLQPAAELVEGAAAADEGVVAGGGGAVHADRQVI